MNIFDSIIRGSGNSPLIVKHECWYVLSEFALEPIAIWLIKLVHFMGGRVVNQLYTPWYYASKEKH